MQLRLLVLIALHTILVSTTGNVVVTSASDSLRLILPDDDALANGEYVTEENAGAAPDSAVGGASPEMMQKMPIASDEESPVPAPNPALPDPIADADAAAESDAEEKSAAPDSAAGGATPEMMQELSVASDKKSPVPALTPALQDPATDAAANALAGTEDIKHPIPGAEAQVPDLPSPADPLLEDANLKPDGKVDNTGEHRKRIHESGNGKAAHGEADLEKGKKGRANDSGEAELEKGKKGRAPEFAADISSEEGMKKIDLLHEQLEQMSDKLSAAKDELADHKEVKAQLDHVTDKLTAAKDELADHKEVKAQLDHVTEKLRSREDDEESNGTDQWLWLVAPFGGLAIMALGLTRLYVRRHGKSIRLGSVVIAGSEDVKLSIELEGVTHQIGASRATWTAWRPTLQRLPFVLTEACVESGYPELSELGLVQLFQEQRVNLSFVNIDGQQVSVDLSRGDSAVMTSELYMAQAFHVCVQPTK